MIYKMLKGRNFRNFFISDVTQGFGVGMSTIGANWFLLDQTGSATAVGLLLAINVIAGFLVFPLVGTLTDKFNRKAIIMWTHLTRSLLIFILTALFFINGFHTIYLYIFTVINGIGWTIYMSASRSLIQEILTKDEYVNGNSLIEISLQVGMFMAGGVSGLLYKYLGFEIILLMNSIAFIVSSIALIRITYKSDIVTENKESFLKNFKGGLSYLNSQKLLFIFGVVSIIPLVSTMIFNVVVPSYVSDSLHADSVVFGMTDMFYGVGGLASGFLAAPLAKRVSSKYAIFLFFITAIIIMTILTINAYIAILFIGSFLIGLSNSSLRILMNSILMKLVDKRFMGRAMSVWMAISLLFQAILAYSLGSLVDYFSPGIGFLFMGILMLLGFIIFGLTTHSAFLKQVNEETEDRAL